jgi:hypothetical protein
MKESNDTMRSDRLKQVMQQIDPHFDEKDAGYNRFSKFVLEASRRKLLVLEKLESGQYEIDLGSDANVPPDSAVAPPVAVERTHAKPPKKDTRRSVEEAAGGGALILANAFALLKRALVDLQAVGDDSTSSKAARERMAELADDPKDPIFEPRRFNRMLRQASDANIIDLVKDGRKYALKLLSEAVAGEEAQPKAEPEVKPEAKPPAQRRKRTRTKQGSRQKPEEEVLASAPSAEEVVVPPSPPETEAKPAPEERQRKRSLRGRGSSRSREAKPGPKATEPTPGVVSEPKPEASPAPEPEVEVVLPRAIPTRRSVRGRGGSRGRRPPSPRPEERREESAPPPPPKDRNKKGARRSTPQTGGVPRHGGQTQDAKPSGDDGPRPRRRGQRRQTTRRPSAESRGQAAGGEGGARKGEGGRNAASRPGPKDGERTSRETKAASSVIEKRVVPEEPKSGGILQRMMQRLRGEEKDD